MSTSCCNPNLYVLSQQGRIVDPGNEKPQRISRTNRSGAALFYGGAVTDLPDAGVGPPLLASDRILGFTIQITELDVTDAQDWTMGGWTAIAFAPPGPYVPDGDIVCVTLADRIKVIAPEDVFLGDPVFIELGTGRVAPMETGSLCPGCTYESTAMMGDLVVLQVNTRVVA